MLSQLEWMRHAAQVCRAERDRLRKLEEEARAAYMRDGESEREWDQFRARRMVLDDELRLREFVLSYPPEALNGQAAVMREYMVQHAELQTLRYGWQISEGEFFERCAVLRRWRDDELQKSVGVPWVRRTEEMIG